MPREWDAAGTGGLSLSSLLSLQSTCQHEGLVTELSWHENAWASPPRIGSQHGLVVGDLPGEVGEDHRRTPLPPACPSCRQRRGQAALREGIGQTNMGGLLPPFQENTWGGVERRCSALHRVGWRSGEWGAASFTFALSPGAHGKALLALAAVGAGGVDASLSSARKGLLTFISIWQQTGRQS